MNNPSFIDKVSQFLSKELSEQGFLHQGKEEAQDAIQILLNAQLRKYNFVTQEEFDAQRAVLASTRQQLEELEQLVSKHLADNKSN